MTRIEDEHGQAFWVDTGDPAWPFVQRLHSKHYSWIVLPFEVIVGWLTPGPYWWCQPLRMARFSGYNSNEGRRLLRLAECLQAVGGN